MTTNEILKMLEEEEGYCIDRKRRLSEKMDAVEPGTPTHNHYHDRYMYWDAWQDCLAKIHNRIADAE